MDTPPHDFGKALAVDAEAVGRPGQRRFRLMVRGESGTAAIWLEKQQLATIGTWLEETATRLDRDDPSSEPDQEPEPFGAIFQLEFRASQIGLGYAEDVKLFALQAVDIERTDESAAPTFRCFLSRGQSRVLSRKIATVVAAGRPICPLCEMPMDAEGHVCPRANGHHLGTTV